MSLLTLSVTTSSTIHRAPPPLHKGHKWVQRAHLYHYACLYSYVHLCPQACLHPHAQATCSNFDYLYPPQHPSNSPRGWACMNNVLISPPALSIRAHIGVTVYEQEWAEVLASPLPVSLKSFNKFDLSRLGLSVLTTIECPYCS